MGYKELDAYIAEQVAQGIDAETVKQALISAGWLEVDVDNALRDVAAGAVSAAAASVKDDLLRMRHAVNALDKRVSTLEARLIASAGETLPSGTMGPEHKLPKPAMTPLKRIALWSALVAIFVLIGYVGMTSVLNETITPMSRIWGEAIIGAALASAGLISGRKGKQGLANLLTGTGLAFASLATISGWYLNFIDWTVALALGALLVTLALVLGRFYDQWALRKPVRARMV